MPASTISVSSETFVNTTTTDRQEWPSTATLDDGGYVVTWTSYNQDGSAGGIYAQRYSADGTPFGGETRVNTTTSSDQVYASIAALQDGGYVISWMSLDQDGSGYGIYTQRYHADGSSFGVETRVNTTTADHQQVQSMGALADGGYVVAWSSPDGSSAGIYAQRYHADGTPFGIETLVNTVTADHQLYSATAGLADGGYIITWMSYGQDGSEWGIYSQRYNADGTQSGGETLVNTSTTSSQHQPAITALDGGGYVIVWMSYEHDGGDIYAQRYNTDGTPSGGEALINVTTAGDQSFPVVTGLSGDRYAIGWTGAGPEGFGAYVQLFAADGTPDGGETLLGSNVGLIYTLSLTTLGDGSVAAAWTGYDGSAYGVVQSIVTIVDPPITGTAGDDVLVGTTHDDVINGLGGNDTLIGDAGNDTLNGGDGNDTIFSSGLNDGPYSGGDIIDGGGGFDIADYSNIGGGVYVDLNLQGVPQLTQQGMDTLISIEGVRGTNGPDTLIGDAGNNVLWGGGHNDELSGNAGNDILYGEQGSDQMLGGPGNDQLYGGIDSDNMDGGAGDDLIDGGAGADDWIFYNSAAAAVVVNLADGTASGGAGNDVLVSIENVTGSAFDDTIIGGSGRNLLAGNGGNDAVYGGIGADVMSGDDGNDLLSGQEGNDLLYGGAGDDVLNGGAGDDTLTGNDGSNVPNDGSDTAAYTDAPAGVVVDLVAGTATGGDGNDILVGIGNIIGSGYGDQLIGDANDNVLSGLDGNDTLYGGDGDDTLDGGDGNDFLAQGGLGNDTLLGGDGADSLFDSYGVNTFDGGAGDDLLFSYSGEAGQIMSGGAGNDYLYANGDSTLSGGDGDDTLYSNGFNSTLSGGAGNDILSAQGSATASGGDGDDTLQGGAGNDTLNGDAGNDYLKGGDGNDILDGGAGSDRVAYADPYVTSGVTVDLTLQGSAQNTGQGMDTLIGIENVSGTAFADILIGDSGANWLWGLPGGASATNNDTLTAGGGNDLLTVGTGNHSLTGGTGTDTVQFTENGGSEPGLSISLALQGAAQATGGGSWTLSGIENLSGGIANDNLTGDAGNNVLAGNRGNDVLAGGAGNDTLYGDGLIGVAAGILANAGADSNLVIGGTGPITLFANVASGNDRLDGGKGDDVLFGGGGDDVLTGGAGVDRFIFGVGSGRDHITDYAKGELIAINGVPGVTGFSNLSIATFNGSAVISWGTGDTITLDGYKGSKLTAADFSFGTTAAGAAAFSHAAGDLREGINSDTYAQGIGGDGASDFMTRIAGFHMTHAGDFLV